MPDTFTPNYNLVKPEVGGSRDSWGSKLDTNFDSLDTLLKAANDKITALQNQFAAFQGFRPGAMADFAFVVPPTGWLKCNGALVSRTTYAALFAAINTTFGAGDGSTTFGLPDIRGLFRRALDDGKGIDAGRAIGATQDSQNLAHNHAPSNNYRFFTEGPDYPVQLTGGSGTESLTYYTTLSGGAEARPKNIAFPVFIKY